MVSYSRNLSEYKYIDKYLERDKDLKKKPLDQSFEAQLIFFFCLKQLII